MDNIYGLDGQVHIWDATPCCLVQDTRHGIKHKPTNPLSVFNLPKRIRRQQVEAVSLAWKIFIWHVLIKLGAKSIYDNWFVYVIATKSFNSIYKCISLQILYKFAHLKRENLRWLGLLWVLLKLALHRYKYLVLVWLRKVCRGMIINWLINVLFASLPTLVKTVSVN